VVAADAGFMQIQWWEGEVVGHAVVALQGTTRDGVDPEGGWAEKVSRR